MKELKRVILKLSGEALSGEAKSGYDDALIEDIARQVKKIVEKGIDVGVVIGGGNYWRGRSNDNIDRTKADQIGMLATIMNCIYVSEIFRSCGIKTNILTPFECGSMTKLFSKDRANKYFEKGMVVFFAGGTGHPYFSTDTGIVLRAIELDADAILLAKAIDGVYDSDPKINPAAKKYDTLPIQEVVDKKLGVIDMTASVMCMENKIKLNGDEIMSDIKEFENKMSKTVDALKEDYVTIRAGRANPHILDKIKVDYYGTPTSLQQVANISVPEARMIQIQPWESSLIKEIEKAILVSDLGITPNNDGKVIRLIFPELTEDRRKELKKKGDNAKVAIRNVRRDANELFKKQNKAGEISDDELKGTEDDIQKLTDKYVGIIDATVEEKTKEILTV